VATSSAGAGLAGLSFTDPQDDAHWTDVAVPVAPGGADAPASGERELRVDIVGAGRMRGLEEWVAETWSSSLLVFQDDALVHEWYADGLGADTLFLGASMTKSVLAHLVGMAVHDGALTRDDPVTSHIPELAGTGYDGTTVRDLLTMTTGVAWVEDHRDPDSRASELLGSFAAGGDSRALLRAVSHDAAPGTRFAYNTADSQVLDWVRERATGRDFADELARLWRALGCTREARVAVDGRGVAMAGGGLAAAARDWARVARLAVDGLAPSGERVLDADWVEEAARPAYPFLGVGRLPSALTAHAGFGYHWWPMDDAGHRVTADGSRGQFACTDRRTGTVVVKTSQWPYDDFLVDRQARDLSYLGLHDLLDALDPPRSTKEYAP
jgi:CubicO group peptidase (beta-lactamase class C family)